MSAQEVEWILVVRYILATHKATYGRLGTPGYTKDYIQLSQLTEFTRDLEIAFPALASADRASITFKWPTGSEEGTIFSRSSDRPHLTWSTQQGAPDPWKMLKSPTEATAQTIRGDPSHRDTASADQEFRRLMSSGFGQPYLIAVKLRDEPRTLHLRVQIADPETQFRWADLSNAPSAVRELAGATTGNRALAWRLFPRGENAPRFDPDLKGNPWSVGGTSPRTNTSGRHGSNNEVAQSSELDSDAIAESLDRSDEEVSAFERRLKAGNYEVPDSTATIKTRGSAQKVFAAEVKKNYGWSCALTGIKTPKFLIASHIVPWSVDEKIRLDPSNGICLSVLIDRAFENGFLIVEDDLAVTIDWKKIGGDAELKRQLKGCDGMKLKLPKVHPPKVEYLKRRRDL
jgi:hypothetical protein